MGAAASFRRAKYGPCRSRAWSCRSGISPRPPRRAPCRNRRGRRSYRRRRRHPLLLHQRSRRQPDRAQLPGRFLARVIARGGVAAAHAAAERFRPLRRSAVREAVGDNGALCLFLQRVVAYRLGGAHAFLDVAGLEDRALSIAGIGGPDSGIAVGLQLNPHLYLVALCGADTLLRLLGLVERAFEVLDMMADLMGNDVGHGEIAGRPEALGQLVEEFGVDVDLLVGRAVEWPH